MKKSEVYRQEITQNYDSSDSNNSHRDHMKGHPEECVDIDIESDEVKQVLQQTTTLNLLGKSKAKHESQMASTSSKNYQFIAKYNKSKDERGSKYSKDKWVTEDSIERPKWTIDDFELGKPLGRGKFGQVYLAREKKSIILPLYYITQSKFIVALKILDK